MRIPRSVIVSAGVSGSGKSTWARRYLLNAPLAYRFIWDDQQGEESYAHRLHRDAATDEWELSVQLATGWVIFNPHAQWHGKLHDALNWFCEWLYARVPLLPGRKALVIDEAWRHLHPTRYPKEIAQCVQSGAGHGLECIFGTQTPEKLPSAIQGECNEVVCFKLGLGGEKSLDWAQARGFDREEIKALTPLHYIARNLDSGGELRGRID